MLNPKRTCVFDEIATLLDLIVHSQIQSSMLITCRKQDLRIKYHPGNTQGKHVQLCVLNTEPWTLHSNRTISCRWLQYENSNGSIEDLLVDSVQPSWVGADSYSKHGLRRSHKDAAAICAAVIEMACAALLIRFVQSLGQLREGWSYSILPHWNDPCI